MSDDPGQLAERLDRLARAKRTEAAALQDVKERREDEDRAVDRRQQAEVAARHATARVENARLALRLLTEAMTDWDINPQLDPLMITGPEQEGPHK